MRMTQITALLAASLLAVPAAAQLGLPRVGLPVLDLPKPPLGRILDNAGETLGQTAERLLLLRAERIDRLLRRHEAIIELDAQGDPARRGELLLVDAEPEVLLGARQAGFTLTGSERMEGLGMSLSSLGLPRGLSLAEGETLLRRISPAAEIAADNLHFQNGGTALPLISAVTSVQNPPVKTAVGIIDGAPAQRVAELRGFAKGAPLPSHHGSAVASLLTGAGGRDLRVADVYGTDPAGGNALALVRALDWLIGGGAKVVSISLTGPNNPAVRKAIAAAQRKGAVIVAAVGNDGPAAPAAYPASYPGVVAVTAVDGRRRPLIEAGRALHLDYAAPGADILAINKAGKKVRVRGTSYAVPLVAARAAAALDRGSAWRPMLDREAEDLGAPGADEQFGRGLLCRSCASRRQKSPRMD